MNRENQSEKQSEKQSENSPEVLLIMGSHRANGNSAYLINQLRERLNHHQVSNEVIDINRLNIKHCLDCAYCKDHWGACVINDDMTNVYALLKKAKTVVFATPVYFNGVSSKLKVLVDRLQMLFICDFEHKRPFVDVVNRAQKQGYILSVGGARRYEHQFIGPEITLKLVFDNLRMPLIQHLTYDNTDRIAVQERPELDSNLDEMVKRIMNGENWDE